MRFTRGSIATRREKFAKERGRKPNQFQKNNMAREITFNLRGEHSTGRVWLNGKFLDPARSLAVRNHSPDGFQWGYGGSGPAQLALAILLEFFPRQQAEENYQDFKFDVIAGLPQTDFDAEIKFTIDDEETNPSAKD